MRQTGRVIAITNGKAEITIPLSGGCGGGCSSCSSKSCDQIVYAHAPQGVRPGDEVVLETNSALMLFSVFLVYILPILCMIMSLIFFPDNIVIASIAAAIALGLAKVYDQHLRADKLFEIVS